MILARERRTSSGCRYYELTESASRQKKSWTPPRNLRPDQIEDALFAAGSLFQSELDLAAVTTPTVSTGTFECTADTLFCDYIQNVFLPRKSIHVAERTRDSWQGYLRLRIYPRLGNLPIGSITVSRITDFILGLQAEGLSISSVRKYHSLLMSIFRMAYTTDVITSNPMDKVDRPRPRENEALPDKVSAYTPEEIAYIERCLRDEPLSWQVYLGILIDSGMRNGECCALQWSDIDFHTKTITISKSLGYTTERGVYLTVPKNKKSRTVTVSDDLLFLLLSLYQQTKPSADAFIFTRHNSQDPIHPHTPGKYLTMFAKRNGIEALHPHKLRHSYASIAITNGADVASVSAVLGHHDPAFTLRVYTSANNQSMTKASGIRRTAVQNAAQCLGSGI